MQIGIIKQTRYADTLNAMGGLVPNYRAAILGAAFGNATRPTPGIDFAYGGTGVRVPHFGNSCSTPLVLNWGFAASLSPSVMYDRFAPVFKYTDTRLQITSTFHVIFCTYSYGCVLCD